MERLLSLPLRKEEWPAVLKKVPHGETHLWKYWEEFVTDFLARGGSRKTIESIRAFMAHLLRNTDAVSIKYCNTPAVFSKTLAKMKEEKGFKNVTHNKYKGCINTYFIWLEDMEYIEENKVRKIRKFREESVEVYALTEDQISEIFNHIYTSNQIPFVKRRNMLFFDLLRATGARRCELLALQPEDIYYTPAKHGRKGGWVIHLHRAKQKGSVDYIDLPDWAGESYRVYMEIRNKTRAHEKLLFASQSKDGIGLTEKGIIYFFEKLEVDLGYKITSKAFRTHVATRLREEGMSIQDISFYLGHKRLSTTMRYIKRTPILHRKCAGVMANQINAGSLHVKNYVDAKNPK